jgi:predicted esterase
MDSWPTYKTNGKTGLQQLPAGPPAGADLPVVPHSRHPASVTQLTEIRTETIEVRRSALIASLGPAGAATRELWYVLHGYAMRAVPFLEDFRAIDDGTRLVVAPEALSRFYEGELSAGAHRMAKVGASWMTRDERESEIADYIAYMDRVHAHVVARLGGASPRVTVLGFSQGGATAARWVARGAVNAARLVVWGSTMPPELDLAAVDAPLRRPEAVFVAGTKDQFITAKVVGQELARMQAAGFPCRLVQFEGGHRMDDDTLRSLAAAAGR